MEPVSVIIPVYNGEKFLDQTIKSVLNQTYKNVEYIIIDDCSQDNSLKIIEKYSDKITIYINKKNLGIIKTVNNAIKRSNGKYILVIGQDDLLESDHIENMIRAFDDNTSLIFCNSIIIDKNNNKIGIAYQDEQTKIKKIQNPLFELSKNNFIHSCGAIFSKEKAEKVGFYEEIEEFPNYGEWLFWIKLSTVGKIKYNSKKRAFYRKHETNITNTFKDKETKRMLYSYYNLCRKTAYNLGNFNIIEKIEFWYYYLFSGLKQKLKVFLSK